MTLKPTVVYVLLCPKTGEIRYVGKTTSGLARRWYEHVRTAKIDTNKTHRDYWIRSLIAGGELPLIEELDSGLWSVETANLRERYWIATFRERVLDLVNTTDGGDGAQPGCTYSQEVRDKVGAASKERWQTSEYREKISEKRKEYWDGNERARAAVSRQSKERWADPNYLGRTSLQSIEYRAKRSEIAKRNSNSPEGIKRLAKNGKKSSLLRRECVDCGKICPPASMGMHLKGTGHSGYLDLMTERGA